MTRTKKLLILIGGFAAVFLIILGVALTFLPRPEPEVTLAGISYSVDESAIGALLDFPDAKAVLDRHLPGLADLRQIAIARPLTLPDIQSFYPELITREKLDLIDAELGELESSGVVVYTTGSTLIGVLLDDTEARDIVDSYLPGFSTNPQIDQGRGFTLRFIQKFDRNAITDEKLANMDADFEALAKSRAGLE